MPPKLPECLKGLESSSMEINKLSIHDEKNQTLSVDLGWKACTSMREIFAEM
jgi:hypothetical protein